MGKDVKPITTAQSTLEAKQQQPATVKITYSIFTVFIGGAADKNTYLGQGPTNIVSLDAQSPYLEAMSSQFVGSSYIGYEEIDQIIPDLWKKYNESNKTMKINIVGHSLGGRQATILSGKLYQKYKIKTNLLITIDPVVGPNQSLGDTFLEQERKRNKEEYPYNTYPYNMAGKSNQMTGKYPNPVAKKWINIYADYTSLSRGDVIASIGGKWIPSRIEMKQPDYDYKAPFSHEDVSNLLNYQPIGYRKGFSAWNELIDDSKKILAEKGNTK